MLLDSFYTLIRIVSVAELVECSTYDSKVTGLIINKSGDSGKNKNKKCTKIGKIVTWDKKIDLKNAATKENFSSCKNYEKFIFINLFNCKTTHKSLPH